MRPDTSMVEQRHLNPLRARRPELLVLLVFGLLATILLLIFKLGSEIGEGDTRAFDSAFLVTLRHATEGTGAWQTALRAVMLDVTAFGDSTTLVLVIGMVTGFLLLARQRRLAVVTVLATGSGTMVTTALKSIFDRPRPDVVAHLTSFGQGSFPSGHAMNSAVAYLTMAALIAEGTRDWHVRIYVLCCAILLTFLVGISRLYLGVHWPTDVLAGWAAGAGWAAMCWSLARWVQYRGGRGRVVTSAANQ